jgi:hypothetical protein
MENDQLFSENELAILRGAQFDPEASRTYDMLSGGFHWSDERLVLAIDTWAFSYVMGYRASLSNGAPREELRAAWDQLRRECPNWPGFRPERRAEVLATDLVQEWNRVEAELNAGIEDHP